MKPVDIVGKIINISHSNLEIEARIGSILNIVAQDMGFQEVLVYTLDTDRLLTCRFSSDKSVFSPLLRGYRPQIGEGIVGSVAQKRAPEYFTIRNIPPRFGCLFYPDLNGLIERYRTFSFLPLCDDSYLYGVLFVASSGREQLSNPDRNLLSMVAREIGGVIRTHQLIVSSKKRISELATLSELGKVLSSNAEPRAILNNIAFIVAKALNSSFVAIKLDHTFLRLDAERFVHGSLDPSSEQEVRMLEGEAIRLNKTVCSRDLASGRPNEGFATVLHAAPMKSKDRLIGTITIGAPRSLTGGAPEENGAYLIETIANYLSSGLENTLLNTKIKDLVGELGSAQKRLLEQETFRNLGEMTANIAHEIKNPLVIIGGFTKRLAKKVQLDHTENRYVDIILKEVSRLESILDEVLNYVRENPMLTKRCNINDFIDELLYLFSSDTGWEQVEIAREYDSNLPPIACDDQQIKQVVINILVNAYDAMQGAGKIAVRTEQKTINNRPFVAISVADTGGGIDPAIIDNVFNPFFTTKEKGTGLGLAISNKIIMHHKGHIEVRNIAGRGAAFTVYLPQK